MTKIRTLGGMKSWFKNTAGTQHLLILLKMLTSDCTFPPKGPEEPKLQILTVWSRVRSGFFWHPSMLTSHNAKLQKRLSGFIWQVMMCDSNVVRGEFTKAENAQFKGKINTAEVKESRRRVSMDKHRAWSNPEDKSYKGLTKSAGTNLHCCTQEGSDQGLE